MTEPLPVTVHLAGVGDSVIHQAVIIAPSLPPPHDYLESSDDGTFTCNCSPGWSGRHCDTPSGKYCPPPSSNHPPPKFGMCILSDDGTYTH